MSSKTTGEMYDEIVLKGTGQYMGSLRNPVSKLRSGPQGRRYNAIYVVNPIEGGEISRVLVSHEDLPQMLKLRSIFIQDNGEVMGKFENRNVSTLKYIIYSTWKTSWNTSTATSWISDARTSAASSGHTTESM